MRRARPLLFFALAAAGAASALYVALHPADLLRDAQANLARGDLRAAQLDLDSLLKGHPHNPEASYRLGLVNLAQGNGVAAERNLRLARDGGYDPRQVIVPLGRAYILQHRADDALQDFTAATAPSGGLAQTYTVRALAYLTSRNLPNAQEAATAALKAAPDDIDAGMTAARIAFVAGRLDAAASLVTHVLAVAPGLAEATVLQADIALAHGDAAGSLRLSQSVMNKSPWRLDAKLETARALIVLNQNEAAIKLLDEARHAAPRSIDARYLRVILAVRQRDYATADTLLDSLSPVLDQVPLGKYLLAVTKLGLGQPAQAVDAAGAFAARHPDDLAAAKLLALADLELGKADSAQAALQAWLDAGHPDADMLDILGRAQTMRGENANAAQSLSAAAALAPRNTEVLNRLAAARLRLGDVAAGTAALRQSLASEPDQPLAAATLVQTALSAGDIAGAQLVLAALRQAAGDSEEVGVLTGDIAISTLDLAGARHAFEGVLKRFPESRGATFGLIRLDTQTGARDAATRRLAAWMKAHPADRDGLAYTLKIELAAGQKEAAIAALKAAHEADQADQKLVATLAQLYLDTHQTQKAVALLERSAVSGGAALLPLRAEAQARNGQPAEAKQLFLQAIDAAPKDAVPRLGLMALCLDAHDTDGARAAIADGLTANPADPRLLQAAVGVEMRAGGVKAGLAKAAALKDDARNLPAAASLTGDVLASVGDQAGAADAYANAFHTAPSANLALLAGTALARSGRPTVAAMLLTAWVGAHPDDTPALRLLATLAVAAHDDAAASRWLARVIALQPTDVVALNNLAWARLATGDVAGARSLAQRAYTLAPGPDTQDTLGWVMARQGDIAAALPMLQQAVAAQPAPAVLYHDAVVLKAAGHAEDARRAVGRALASPRAFDERANAEALQKQLSP